MADIFISYSSRDRMQAKQLGELLASAGLSIWIDQSGIDAATSWSKEIVQAINDCKAFLVLLSPSSLESHNVIKEVTLASEKQKKILPLELESVKLTEDFEYQLAGIQRAPVTNIDAIFKALRTIGLEATQAPTQKIVKEKDSRKSLMILPFEDLSPTGDNGWFADGIVIELVSALGNVKALRLIDWNTSKEFKTRKVPTATLAKELEVRYFLEGQVRKADQNIKISVSLLDFETGDHLWLNSMKGTMEDVFDIQEKVAEEVVGGLKVHLASAEKKKLAERGTEDPDAYELFLKALEHFNLNTREGFDLAIHQLTLAIELDPTYANALRLKAGVLAFMYRSYDRDLNLLTEAELLAQRALEIDPDLWSTYQPLSEIYRLQGRVDEAVEIAKKYVLYAPKSPFSYFSLGFFYTETNQPELAIAAYEKALELKPDDLNSYWNLISVSARAHDMARVEQWSRLALPHYERRLRLVPDDEHARVSYASLLRYAGEPELAVEALAPLLQRQNLDALSLYNIACLYVHLDAMALALEAFRRTVAAGYRNIDTARRDPDLDPLRGMPEFKELMRQLEEKQRG